MSVLSHTVLARYDRDLRCCFYRMRGGFPTGREWNPTMSGHFPRVFPGCVGKRPGNAIRRGDARRREPLVLPVIGLQRDGDGSRQDTSRR